MRRRVGAVCASVLFIAPSSAVKGQSIEDFLPDYRLDERSTFERRVGEAFRSMPEADPSRPPPLSVDIGGGARVAPDFKRRGLKVTVPTELIDRAAVLAIAALNDEEEQGGF